MKLLVLILNKTEALEELLEAFVDNGIKGATIISSTGMAHAIGDYHDGAFLGSLRKYFHLCKGLSQCKDSGLRQSLCHDEKLLRHRL